MQLRLLKHLTDHNILSTEQYGFRTKLKTDNATYRLTNEILNALNNKVLVGGIFCDLEKVFDCVNHGILSSQLEFYGITGKHYELYKSYLTNSYQRTLLHNQKGNDVTSAWAKVKHGAPRVVLGPLHFLIFLNDLPVFVRVNVS